MNNKGIVCWLCLLFANASLGQVIIKDTLAPHFEWRLYVLDAPYFGDAAHTEAIRALDGFAGDHSSPKLKHHLELYRNLSMKQSIEMARNLHGSLYYANSIFWNKWVKPTNSRKYFLNKALANITALGTDLIALKLPYGYAFLHEEYHRAVLTTRHVYSYDEVWKMGKGLDIAVTRVKDEDLVMLKSKHPADQVRLSAAGVEAEYNYLRRMRMDNFFEKSGYPMVGISVLGTLHAINYVNLPFAKRFNSITDSILAHDKQDILARDFTGYDFSAWVYDLFTPHEPYEARGNWPGGVGIKRPIKETELTPQMKRFLKQTGRAQYINLLSPFHIGINRLQIKPGYYFNFAFRSVPTASGYYAGADFFLDFKDRKMLIGLGMHKSQKLSLPALDVRYYNLLNCTDARLNADVQLWAWLQPRKQLFAASKATPGMALDIQPRFSISPRWSAIADLSFKTKGWVMGNPYLDSKWSGSIGFSFKTL